jgi:hypothetical protein
MPFASKAQKNFLYANKPEVAEKYAEHTPKKAYKGLPEKVRDKNGLMEISKKLRRKKNG